MTDESPPPADDEDDDPLTRIAAAPRFGTGLGLHRIAALAPAAATPAAAFSVKIVGSHGKGSTAVLTDAMLTRCGLRTGRFLSPHVLRPNERIAVGGVDLDDDPLRAAVDYALDLRDGYEAANPGDQLSGFEIWFLAALTAFAAARVDVMVLEAGIGGRFDPVRWAPGGVAALTGVDLEHVALLGPTREHIAFDKADVLDAGGRLAIGRLDADLRRRLDAYLKLKRVTPIHLMDRATVSARTAAFDGMPALACAFDSPHPRFAENAALAKMLTEEALRGLRRPPPDPRAMNMAFTDACAGFRPPGRLRRLGGGPEIWADIAHSPAAVGPAVQGFLAAVGARRCVVMFGAAADKPLDALAQAAVGAAPPLPFTALGVGAAAPTVAAALERAGALKVATVGQVEAALAQAADSVGPDGAILVVGSVAGARAAAAWVEARAG